MQRPKVLLYCDRPDWAYHTTATQLMEQLKDRYDFDLVFAQDFPQFDASRYDVIYVFWWGERRHRAYLQQGRKVTKEISSHRWQHQAEFGQLTPDEADERWMTDASHLVATSRRLADAFRNVNKPVFHYPLGIDPAVFYRADPHDGQLVVGWAGNPADPAKRFNDIILPACDNGISLKVANGSLPLQEMPDFYRSLDVILVASIGEGTPLPLIEAMACGCFPISTDVGVAPEVIEHGHNGLIVEPTVAAFADALKWCTEHPEIVRLAGAENAVLIRTTRTWWHSAERFAEILDRIIMAQKDTRPAPPSSSNDKAGYERHFDRINPNGLSESAYQGTLPYLRQEIAPLLPADREVKILEIGTGHGHLIHFLADERYSRIFGIDVNDPLLREVLKRNAHQVEAMEVADALDYLPRHNKYFDCILMLDVIEHFSLNDARNVLRAAADALNDEGRLILRTPNMANLLGGYSRYMDLTHLHGYTEWSLIHLLEQCNLPGAQTFVPKDFASSRQRIRYRLNYYIHKFLYRLNDRAEPQCYGKNVVVWVDKR